MRTTTRRTPALLLAVLLIGLGASGCAGFFDSYPNPQEPADLAGTWTHGSGHLALTDDGTFEMTDMPAWVAAGDSSAAASTATVTCSGTWTFHRETQNISLQPAAGECGLGLFATGREDEMTIAFGIDNGSGDPRCYELVREGSALTPRGIDECLQYN